MLSKLKLLFGKQATLRTDSYQQSDLLLDYKRLAEILEHESHVYGDKVPFPHTVIDDFLPKNVLESLLSDYPFTQENQPWIEGTYMDPTGKDFVQKSKRHLADQLAMPSVYRNLIWELHSAPFLDWLGKMSGIRNLIPDPGLFGAGIHQISRGGLLKIHTDFPTHRKFGLDRRLNFLLYLNRDWQESWGGHLELWDKDMEGPPVLISPQANRCVLFTTTSTSFHGHPHPLKCPQDIARKSLALYYYTNGRPEGEVESGFATNWKEIPAAYKAGSEN